MSLRVGLGIAPKMSLIQASVLASSNFPGHDQRRVVGLIILVIEVLQALDRHVLDIAARADRRAAVAVPQIGSRHDALEQNPLRAVLAHLEFVAHDGHFAIEVGAGDAGVNHAVGFHFERPTQILLGGGHGFEVVGAVVIGRAVEAGAVGAQLGHDVRALVRALDRACAPAGEPCRFRRSLRSGSRPDK